VPELRKDPVDGTWVIVSTERCARPLAIRTKIPIQETEPCPFCPGNETETPKEVFALRPGGSERDEPGWQIRVFPNKYPALRLDGAVEERGDELFVRKDGVGVHEVIVETTVHDLHLADMDSGQLVEILKVYAHRIRALSCDPRIRCVLVFRNHGFLAGATKLHPHSQVVGLPRVPRRIERELEGAKAYHEVHKRCVFCDILHREIEEGTRILLENEGFVVLAPYASRIPYELAIYPRNHAARFEDEGEEGIRFLGEALKKSLGAVRNALGDPSFHYIIHTAPVSSGSRREERSAQDAAFHWHIEILPRMTSLAGFEWGSGMYINIVSPEEATALLRSKG
jgi:UDPglucose--hexose-1-phosphate uridylyltransferase